MDFVAILKTIEYGMGPVEITIKTPDGKKIVVGAFQERPCSFYPLSDVEESIRKDLEIIQGDYNSYRNFLKRFFMAHSVLFGDIRENPQAAEILEKRIYEAAKDVEHLKVSNGKIWYKLTENAEDWWELPPVPYEPLIEVCLGDRPRGVYDFLDGEFLKGFQEELEDKGIRYFKNPLEVSLDGVYTENPRKKVGRIKYRGIRELHK